MKLVDLRKTYQGKFLTYYIADYLNKDNKIKSYEFVSRNPSLNMDNFGNGKPAGVGMVTFSLDKKQILLLKEYRLATKNWVYNFPAGLIDKGETPEIAAVREIREETGVEHVEIDAVLSPSFASQGTSDELMSIVICRCEGKIKPSCFADEEIEAGWYTKEEIKKLLDEGVYMSVRTQMFLWQWVNEEYFK